MRAFVLRPRDERRSAVWPYEVTPEDVLWLSRAVETEGPPQPLVARALVNLFVMVRDRGYTKSLGELVRAYAQPVSPEWEDKGTDAQRRRRAAARTRVTFSAGTDAAVHAALSAPWFEDVTDYAAHTLDATKKGYTLRVPGRAGLNAMWTRSPGWGGYVAKEVFESSKLPARIMELAAKLPRAEREPIERTLEAILRSELHKVGSLGDSLLEGVKVIRPGEPGFEEARANAHTLDSLLGLSWENMSNKAVNALQGLYDAVAERASEVARGIVGSVVPWLLLAVVAWMVLED